jgi:hypothetical protein
VPQSEFSVTPLAVAPELPKKDSGVDKAKAIVELGDSVNKFGRGVGAWGKEDKKPSSEDEDEEERQEQRYDGQRLQGLDELAATLPIQIPRLIISR